MKYLSRGFKLNLGFKIWYTFGAVPLHELRDSIRFSAQVSGGVGGENEPHLLWEEAKLCRLWG